MCTPWKDALVINFWEKLIQHIEGSSEESLETTRWIRNHGLVTRIHLTESKLQGGFEIIDWSPEFTSPEAKVKRTVVWIRFPGLNLVYYDESFLLAMASAIGRPIKVDNNTLRMGRGRFARVCGG